MLMVDLCEFELLRDAVVELSCAAAHGCTPAARLPAFRGHRQGCGRPDCMCTSSTSIGKAIEAIKADDVSLELQNEFFRKSAHPLDTPQ